MSAAAEGYAGRHEAPRIRFARAFAHHDASLRLYALLDGETCERRSVKLLDVAKAWRAAGVRLMQYRDKQASRATVVENARTLRKLFPAGDAFLLLNDHPDLVEFCGFDGAHVGQRDFAVAEAREQLGPDRILGVSTHSADQALTAQSRDVDYIAIGPVFTTSTKQNAEPTVGLCGVQAARAVVSKPLVAIGGIQLGDARAVEMAGADSVAVISALVPSNDLASVEQTAKAFLARLR